MNYRLVGKLLGLICLLIGITMLFCLPWAFPSLGRHTHPIVDLEDLQFESRGFLALSLSTLVCFVISGVLIYLGRHAKGQIFLREAMAIVGLSWVLATILGALPFLLSGVHRGCAVRSFADTMEPDVVYVSKFNWNFFDDWYSVDVSPDQKKILDALINPPSDIAPRKALGLTQSQIVEVTGLNSAKVDQVLNEMVTDSTWSVYLLPAGIGRVPPIIGSLPTTLDSDGHR